MRREVELYDESLKHNILTLPYSTKIDDNGIDCDMVFIPKSDYGFAEIYRFYDDILVFLIPEYGGTPYLQYNVKSHNIDFLINELRQLT